jgi:hypothetical protein
MSGLEMFYFTPTYGVSLLRDELVTVNPDLIPGTSEHKNDIMTANLLKIRDAEIDIIHKLVTYDDYVENEETGGVEKIDKQLPPETENDIALIFQSLRNNPLLPELQSLLAKCNDLTFRVSIDTVNGLNDVLGLDQYFLKVKDVDVFHEDTEIKLKSLGIKSYCVVCVDGPMYYGRIWIFERPEFPDFLGMYGIRGSVVNLLVRKCATPRRGIAKILLRGVRRVAEMWNKKKIIVPWPLAVMTPILKEAGFNEVTTSEPTDVKSFLEPVTSTTNYFSLDL